MMYYLSTTSQNITEYLESLAGNGLKSLQMQASQPAGEPKPLTSHAILPTAQASSGRRAQISNLGDAS
jgi:hypothetical protein